MRRMPRFLPDKAGGATGKSLIVLDPRLSLNQRVPGSSPGAPTKSNKALAMIEHQNGSFSLEIGMIRLNFGETTWFRCSMLKSFASAFSRHEIQRADQFVKVNWMPIVQWDIGAKKHRRFEGITILKEASDGNQADP